MCNENVQIKKNWEQSQKELRFVAHRILRDLCCLENLFKVIVGNGFWCLAEFGTYVELYNVN